MVVYIFYICVMKVKEYLISEDALNLSVIARRMWPKNSDAKTYLSRKLNDKLPWTKGDTEKAKSVLKDLGADIQNLE